MNVAMLGTGFVGWAGGIDFLKAYVQPLKKINGVKVYLLLPRENPVRKWIRERKNDLLNCVRGNHVGNVVSSAPMEMEDIAHEFEAKDVKIIFYNLITTHNRALIRTVKEFEIDIVFPSSINLGTDFPVPWVQYLPDFQHKYYPAFFTEEECKARDKSFHELLQNARAVIVEAADVRKDILKYYPDTKAKIFVMPYAAIPEPEWLELNDVSLEKYHLPQRYFLISNQFWIHKDHMTAFEALARLVQEGEQGYDIVCTGLAKDYRDMGHLDKIMRRLKELGIEKKVHFLGYIPKRDQMKIMCASVAVIQPTLFEGNPGGGIAYNAVSLGVPIILSDIPVNQELKAEWVRFFHAGDSEDLERAMKAMIREKEARYIPKESMELLALGEERMSKLTNAVYEVLKYIVANYNG